MVTEDNHTCRKIRVCVFFVVKQKYMLLRQFRLVLINCINSSTLTVTSQLSSYLGFAFMFNDLTHCLITWTTCFPRAFPTGVYLIPEFREKENR